MSFLAPLFFVALAGLAIPVLLHLTQREKKQVQRFPSLMFVRRIPYQSVRRRKIQNWLLLLVRMAALALIVLAFARPFLSRPDAPLVPGQGAREVVVLLDTSYSMGFGDRWGRAQAAAAQAVQGLGSSDRGSVVLFSSSADILVRSSAERERLASAVAGAKPGAGSTRYAPALKVAGSILAESQLPRREVVLVSDLQRGGWRGEEGARLPAGTTLTPVVIGGPVSQPNLTVTGVSLARSTFANQERVVVTAGVSNRSEQRVAGASATLEMGGLPIGTRPLTLEPGASASVTFDPVTIGGRNMRGTVELSADALAADNLFHFVLSPAEPVRVAVLDRGGASSLYLSQALAIGEAPRFETVVRQPEALSDGELQRSAVVVLNDVAVADALARRLAAFVERGGGLLVAAGARASWPGGVDLLPASIGAPVDRTRGTAARMGAVEYASPVFEPFRAPGSGEFATTRIYGYRSVSPVSAALVLARFDTGAPAMLERRVGNGRALLWTSSLDQSWSDLPIKPVFLPLVHRAVSHLAVYREPQPWVTVGQVLEASAAGRPRERVVSRVVLTPSGERSPLGDEGEGVLEVREQGFYEIRGAASDVTVVAGNVDPAEGDLTPMDPQDIVAAAAGGSAETARAAAVPQGPEAQERNQRIWWYLLCAGVVLLGVDTALSNRTAKA